MTKDIVSITLKKNKNTCRINFSNGEEIEVHYDLVLKHALSKGKKLSQDEYDLLIADNMLLLGKQKAYNYASYAPRTQKQIVDKLKLLGYTDEINEKIIAFLINFNLIDDEKYANAYISTKLKTKAVSKAKLKRDLYAKGVATDEIDKAIEQNYEEELSLDMALKATEKKMRLIQNKKPEKQIPSLVNFLVGQGFSWDTIRQVLEQMKTEDEGETTLF